MKKLTILVDLDSVVADTLPTWLYRIYEKTGVLASVNDITSWSICTCHPLSQLPPNEIIDILNEPGFTMGIPVLADANVHLKQLHDQGHKIYFVTARFGPVIMPETLAWMRKHFPWLPPEKHVCFVSDKNLMQGDILVDDRAENLIAYHEQHPSATLITIRYPYNRGMDADLDVAEFDYNSSAWERIRVYIEWIANGRKNTVCH